MNMKESSVTALHPMNELNDLLRLILKKEVDNAELQKTANIYYAKKNLSMRTVACLFDETKDIRELDETEKIALTFAFYEGFKTGIINKNIINNYEELNPINYFSNAALVRYNSFINEVDTIDSIKLNNYIMIDDFNYRGNITYKQIYDYRKNSLLLYNRATQRASKIVELGNSGEYVYQNSVDEKAVREIKEAILNNTFEESEIILNVRLVQDKEPNFRPIEKVNDIFDINITPNYNYDSEKYTVVEILDGYHRILAIEQAVAEHYKETGKWLENKIGVKLVLADEKRALRIVRQTFKRTATDEQYLKSIEQNDITEFVDKVIENSDILRNNVANTYEESLAFNKLTYKAIMNDVVKYLNIDVNKFSVKNFMSKKFSMSLDLLYNIINENRLHFNEEVGIDESKLKILKNPNIISAYMTMIYYSKEKEIISENVANGIINNILKLTNKDIQKLNLNNRNCSVKKIINKFAIMIKEVA